MDIIVRPRRAGKTYALVQWALAGEKTDSYPGWTRVILVASIEASIQLRSQYPALDYRQVFWWDEWRRARLGARPVEVAVDNIDILVANRIGQMPVLTSSTGQVLG